MLIPCSLGPEDIRRSSHLIQIIDSLDCCIVENARSARRWMRSIGYTGAFDDFAFLEFDKHLSDQKVIRRELYRMMQENKIIGVISEAGLPALADPGAELVALAHQMNYPVKVLAGASSVILALVGSGFDGQRFSFHGYLPRDKAALKKRILELEKTVKKTGYTQLFMETPYRNQKLAEQLIHDLSPNSILSISAGLESLEYFCRSALVSEWRSFDWSRIHKVPAIFALGNWGCRSY